MHIVILGGSGFVGTHLVKLLLLHSKKIVIGDIKKSESFPEIWEYCDIRKKEQLLKTCASADIIINLAAEHRDNVTPISLYDEVNILGSRIICEVANELGIKRIIFTSSVAIYGFPEKSLDESGEIKYFNDYGRTKWLAEMEYRKWKDADTTNRLTIIRPTVIFGEGNRGNVFNLMRQIASKKFLRIGSGLNKKSMAYVGNVCNFIEFLINQNYADETFNYVDKPDYNMKDLIALINTTLNQKLFLTFAFPRWVAYAAAYTFDCFSKVTKRKYVISVIRVKKFESQTVFDSSKMLEYGFQPPYALSESLERTIKYEFQ